MHGAIGCRSIAEIEERLDTVTLYVGAARQAALLDALVAKRPGRVIFNPGAESSESERRLHAAGIETLHACTLVLLRSGEF